MINGKEIRACWSDLSIFISLPFIVQKEKKLHRPWVVLLFGGDGVVAITAAGDIFFNDSPYSVVC